MLHDSKPDITFISRLINISPYTSVISASPQEDYYIYINLAASENPGGSTDVLLVQKGLQRVE